MRFKKSLLAFVLLDLSLSTGVFPEIDADGVEFGPAPRRVDGRFTNSIGELSHGPFGVRFPFFLRRIAGSFHDRSGAPERIPNDGVFLRDNARMGPAETPESTVTWIGHSTLLIQMGQVSFLTDPIWSDAPSPFSFAGPRRFVEPGLAIEDLPRIDFVIVSHNHYDHLDLPTLVALAERDENTRFFVPIGNGDLLRESGIDHIHELDWGDSARYRDISIHCLPAQHWSKRGLGDDLESLWSSWAVIESDHRFYFAGDTGYFDGFAEIGRLFGPFDLAALPIGAYAPREMMKSSHMNPEEAVRAAIDLRAQRAIAIHFGTFDLSDEPLEEPPQRFIEAVIDDAKRADPAAVSNRDSLNDIEAVPFPALIRWVFRIGETRPF